MKNNSSSAFVIGDIGLVQTLGSANITINLGYYDTRNVALYSKYVFKKFKLCSYNHKNFITQLCEIGRELGGKPVLYTDNDQTLLKISSNREVLSEYFTFLLPSHEIVLKILDKTLFVDLCNKYDLPAPESFALTSDEDLNKIIPQVPFPCIIKPVFKENWWNPELSNIMGGYKKAFICQNEEELEATYKKLSSVNSRMVVQKYIPGADSQMYDINLFVTPDIKIVSQVIARKMRVHPPGAGFGCFVQTVYNPTMNNLCMEIIEKLNLKGLLNIQFKQNVETGKYELIEIHPRVSIFEILGAKAGQNIPAIYFNYLIHNEIAASSTYIEGITYLEPKRDIKLLLKHRSYYKIPLLTWISSYFGVSVIAGFRVSDMKPFLYDLYFMLKRNLF